MSIDYSDVAVIIPSRVGSTRLARKSLALIGDLTLIEHVVTNVKQVPGLSVYVATDSNEIASVVEKHKITPIMTDPSAPTGTDRVYQAYDMLPNKNKINYIINVQGDMPFVNPSVIIDIITQLKVGNNDIITPVVRTDNQVASSYSNVKVVIDKIGRAIYFSRSPIPYGATEFLYHVGIYGYTKEALHKFISLEQTNYEKTESLEQLRALEYGMKIGICYTNQIPISVDTIEDLMKAREYYKMLT